MAPSHSLVRPYYACESRIRAEAKGVMLQEGLWTRYFPAVEHARALLEEGAIGDVVMARADFPDRCYAAQLSPLALRITIDGYGHAPTTLKIHLIPPDVPLEPQGHTSTSQNGVEPCVARCVYPVPQPKGYPAPGWHYTNQTGFVYQAEAVHRCLAAGLLSCPQYTKVESLHVLTILDQVVQSQQLMAML